MTEQTTTSALDEEQVPANTDADNPVEDQSSDQDQGQPSIEQRDGKFYLDGNRIYTRDDINRIAANSKREAEKGILESLEVDSIDTVRDVVSQLRTSEGESLDVGALKDAVKKREQTVEELRKELTEVRQEYAVREHVGNLKDAMPSTWSAEQKQGVIDLMRARDMLAVQDDKFYIRDGDDYLTKDGEQPDYALAVERVGRSLGLPFGKRGMDTYHGDNTPGKTEDKPVDQERLRKDPQYRAAYVKMRENGRISRDRITDTMIRKQLDSSKNK